MDIEDKIIESIKISDICVPSDILTDCEKIYKNFKNMYDKYAPGKLAFFKFNSTIVNNLEKLIKNGCTDLYKISVYQSYFRNCNNINDIDHKTNKISGKLTSLLEAIGTSKKASSSTLGVKGLFTKKRSCDNELNEYYNYFEELQNCMISAIKCDIFANNTTVKINSSTTNLGECMKGFKFLSYNNNKITTQTYKNGDPIPSYVDVMSTFLNNAIKKFNELYILQKNFKKLYDPKSTECYYSNGEFDSLKRTYQWNYQKIIDTKKELPEHIKALENAYSEFMKFFGNDINEKAKNALLDILKPKSKLENLYKNIKDNDKNIRNQFIFSDSSIDVLGELAFTTNNTRTNILRLKEWVSGGEKYSNISNIFEMDSPLYAIPLGLDEFTKIIVEKFPKSDPNGTKCLTDLQSSLKKYNNNITKINRKFENISKNTQLSIKYLKSIQKGIKDKQKKEAFNKLLNKVAAIGTLIGTPLALVRII